MRRFAILFATLTLAVAGCRQDPYMEAYIDTLNLEKLALEDRLYELEYDYDKLLEQLKRSESGKSSRTTPRGSDSGPTLADPPARESGRNGQSQDREDPQGEGPSIQFGDDSREGPSVEFGDTPPSPLDFSPPPGGEEDAPAPPFDLESFQPLPVPSGNRSLDSQKRRAIRTNRLSSIQIDRRYTGSEGTRNDESPSALRVVIQPRDSDSRFLPATGKLAIVAFDVDTKERVARWDLPPDEVAKLLSKSSPRGIDFRTEWPATAAKTKRLHLYARLTTSDGRELKSDREIDLTASHPASPQWTARADQRQLIAPRQKTRQTTRQVSGQEPVTSRGTATPAITTTAESEPPATPEERDTTQSPEPSQRPAPKSSRRKPIKPEWKPYR